MFVQLYGQSEAPNFITRLRREDHTTDPELAYRLRSCGQPTALAQVRIVDDEGHDCPPGTEGEVVARTAFTMTGYHELPEVTSGRCVTGGSTPVTSATSTRTATCTCWTARTT